MRGWKIWMISLSVCFFTGNGILKAQVDFENEDLLYHTWKIKKIYVNGEKKKRNIYNDHLVLDFDKFWSYDSGDKTGKYIRGGKWKLDKTGTFLIQYPGTPHEQKMKIMNLDEESLVVQMDVMEKTWEIHMRAED